MIVRTVDEIKAYYEELREAFNRTDSDDDDWVGESIKEKWLLLDRIAQLEARCAELERNGTALDGWRSVEELPEGVTDPIILLSGKQIVYSDYVETLVTVKSLLEITTHPDGKQEKRWDLYYPDRMHISPINETVGWRPLPAPQPSPDQP